MPTLTLEVLAGAYRGKRRDLSAMLTHAVTDEADRALCGQRTENLADRFAGDTSAEPTCKRCRARDPRFK